MRLKQAVEIVEYNAGLDYAATIFDVKGQQTAPVFRPIDNDAIVDRLPALKCTASAQSPRCALALAIAAARNAASVVLGTTTPAGII